MNAYAKRVRQLELEGLTTSDAQSVADVEEQKEKLAMTKRQRETHTPGPWKITRDMYGVVTAIGPIQGTDEHFGIADGNAYLIAAALDLLAVVKAAEKWAMLTQTDSVPWLDDATSAIAKAEGSAA